MNLPDKSNRFPQMVRHMSRSDDLVALRDAVQAGDFVKFRIIAKVLASEARDIGKTWPSHDAQKAMSGSVDAALAFLAAALPGWAWSIKTLATDNVQAWTDRAYGLHQPGYHGTTKDNPARALLLATLNALIAEVDKANTTTEKVLKDG